MTGGNGQLRAFFERVERLHEERKAIGEDITEVFAEAKGSGFDVKVMKIVLQKRRMDHAERLEQEALVDLYMAQVGMDGTALATRAPAREITHSPAPDPSGMDDAPGADPHTTAPGATESTAALKEVPATVRMKQEVPPQPEPQDRIGGSGNDPQAVYPPAGTQAPPVDTYVSPAQRAMDAVLAKRFNPETHFLNSQGLKRLHGCKQPETCAGSHRERCFTCAKDYAEEMGFSA